MKLRFLALLAAVATGSAAVLIYASNSRHDTANTTGAAHDDCGACAMSAAKSEGATIAKSDSSGCCASEVAAKPEVATLATAGCPYEAGASTTVNAAVNASVETTTASTKASACCASEE